MIERDTNGSILLRMESYINDPYVKEYSDWPWSNGTNESSKNISPNRVENRRKKAKFAKKSKRKNRK